MIKQADYIKTVEKNIIVTGTCNRAYFMPLTPAQNEYSTVELKSVAM